VELWSLYISYLKEVNTVDTPEYRKILTQGYEFLLSHIGYDFYCEIWLDYINFIKSWPNSTVQEENMRLDALRRTFHRAIAIPLKNIEQIWKEFDSFENSINKQNARKVIGEKSATYMSARAACRELMTLMESIDFNMLAEFPKWNEIDFSQLQAWKKYLQWEISNPLNLNDCSQRIIFAFRKSLMFLRFYPEIWDDFICYLISNELPPEEIIEQAIIVNENCLLLNFRASEYFESIKKFENSKNIFEILVLKLTKTISSIQIPEKNIKMEEDDEEDSDGNSSDEEVDEWQNLIDSRNLAIAKLNLTWIEYMKYCKRSEGIKGIREVFNQARKNEYCSYHVYVASALIEYNCNKDKMVAYKIFELGMKHFNNYPEYINAYLDLLINLNDDINARSLFERVVTTMATEKSKSIWNRYLEFENSYGELDNIEKIVKRRRECYPNEQEGSSILFAIRHSFMGLNVIFDEELGFEHLAKLSSHNVVVPDLPIISKKIEKTTNKRDGYSLPSTKEEETANPPKNRAFTTVTNKKICRPNLDQFNIFKPDLNVSNARREAVMRNPPQRVDSPTPSQSSDQMSQESSFPAHLDIVNAFLELLPPAFSGPILRVDDILQLIVSIQLISPPDVEMPHLKRKGVNEKKDKQKKRKPF
jgi:cleavage stimulation factor subunit 3